ncbi:MAG: site-2 protease family protein [archaeon]|nr:MAG: site-2 protease family protein [archaeon]
MYSGTEIRDLLISTVVLGVIFSLSDLTLVNLVSSLFVVGFAFLLHEIAHRETARKFGARAVYRVWPSGLLMAIILGIVSWGSGMGVILFAAPGAVHISPVRVARWKARHTSLQNEEYGIISLAGPLVNLGLSTLFLFLNSLYPSGLLVMGAVINIYIAFFNLLPVPPFDGFKVMRWCRKTWLITFITALVGLTGIWLL